MIIDLQMTTDHFLRGIRNQLRGRSFCYIRELNLGTTTAFLDHLEVTDRTTLRRVPQQTHVVGKDQQTHVISGSAVQVTQEVVLNFVTLSAVQNSGDAPTAPVARPSVTIQVVLTVTLSNGVPMLRFEYRAPADAGGLSALIPDAGQQIDAAMSGFTGIAPLNLSGLASLLGGSPLFVNAGMVVDDSARVLTLRLEDGTDPDTVQSWANFFAGTTPDRLNGHSWGIFVDKRLLLPLARAVLDAGTSSGEFRPSGDTSADWAGSGHGIHCARSGVLPDAGPFDTDVHVTVNVDLDFSLPAPDVLLLGLSISASGEVGGIVGAVMDFLGLSADPSAALPATAGWKKTGDQSYERRAYLQIGNPLLGHLTVEGVVPDPDGLHLVGSVRPATAVVPARVAATVQPFAWGVHGSCNGGWRISAVGYLGLTNAGTAPLTVCEARVVFDPDKQFPVTVEMADSPSSPFAAVIRVEVGALKPEYAQRPSPYPCLLLVKTNGGARFVSLGVPGSVNADERKGMESEVMIRVVNCKQLVDAFWGSRLNPKWIPDPSPDSDELHLWQVLVRGVDEHEQVTMLDSDGRVVATGTAGRNGVAYVRSVVAAGRDGREMTVLRAGREGYNEVREDGGDRAVEVRQVRLDPAGEVPLREPVDLLAGRYQQIPVLVVAGPTSARLYDVSAPRRPALFQDLPLAELAGSGLDLVPTDVPAGFGDDPPGPTRMRPSGVLVGEVFARVRPDRAAVTLYRAGQATTV
jgi:hypothetical protein